MKNKIWVTLLAVGGFAWAMSADATTIDLNNLYTGTAPETTSSNNGTWLIATLEQSSGTYTVTGENATYNYEYTLNLLSQLTNKEKVQGSSSGAKPPIGWAFNFTTTSSQSGIMAGFQQISSGNNLSSNPASGIVYNTFTMTSPNTLLKINQSQIGTGSVPVKGGYDLAFYWQGGFGGSDSVSYKFYSNDVWSITDQTGGFASVAHVQGIGNCSGWITDSSSNVSNGTQGVCNPSVPEPAEWTLMFPGLLLISGLAFWSRKRTMRKEALSAAG